MALLEQPAPNDRSFFAMLHFSKSSWWWIASCSQLQQSSIWPPRYIQALKTTVSWNNFKYFSKATYQNASTLIRRHFFSYSMVVDSATLFRTPRGLLDQGSLSRLQILSPPWFTSPTQHMQCIPCHQILPTSHTTQQSFQLSDALAHEYSPPYPAIFPNPKKSLKIKSNGWLVSSWKVWCI